MTKKAILVLEDGTVYQGDAFGAGGSTYGEVVFDTARVASKALASGSQLFNVKRLPEYLMS